MEFPVVESAVKAISGITKMQKFLSFIAHNEVSLMGFKHLFRTVHVYFYYFIYNARK